MGDLYMNAGSDTFGITFCAPMTIDGDLYGALCYDINIKQRYIPFIEVSQMSLDLQSEPLILQSLTNKFLRMLQRVAINEGQLNKDKEAASVFDFSDGWSLEDSWQSEIYDGVVFNTGGFYVPES